MVGTPGRVIDLMDRGDLNLSEVGLARPPHHLSTVVPRAYLLSSEMGVWDSWATLKQSHI